MVDLARTSSARKVGRCNASCQASVPIRTSGEATVLIPEKTCDIVRSLPNHRPDGCWLDAIQEMEPPQQFTLLGGQTATLLPGQSAPTRPSGLEDHDCTVRLVDLIETKRAFNATPDNAMAV